MNILDIILLLPLVYGLIQGVRNGFVKEIGAFVAIFFGIYLARYWYESLSQLFAEWFHCSQSIAIVIAYIVAFIIGALGIHLIAILLSKILNIIKIGWINKTIGAIFGTFKWLLILSLILNFIAMVNQFAPIVEKKAVRESILYKPIENVMGNLLPFLDFNQVKNSIKQLSK